MPSSSTSTKKSKAPVQAKLGFRTTKGTATSSKPLKGVKNEITLIRSNSRSNLSKATVVEEKKQLKRRRARDSDEESEPEEDDDDDFEEPAEDDDEPAEPAPQVAPVRDVKLAKPEEDEEDEDAIAASPVIKGKEVPKGMNQLIKDSEFTEAYKVAKEAIGGNMTVSVRNERKAMAILRVFDLSYEYGPCVGMTRMERWERASRRGLNPPEIVRLILETGKVDNLKDEELSALEQSVFHGMV